MKEKDKTCPEALRQKAAFKVKKESLVSGPELIEVKNNLLK